LHAKSLDYNRKHFEFDLLEFANLNRIDGETARLYETPTGQRYPSVTTVLGKMSDKTALNEWRKRVGDEEANRISARAASRGTSIHNMCEKYILDQEFDTSLPHNMVIFRQIKGILDEKVDMIRATECTLFSHHLKIAGTCDLIADYDGRLSIIDYKTSTKRKRKDWIEGYFLQCSLYAYMLWEMTGIAIKDIVIIIGVDDEIDAQVFVERPSNYIEKAADMVRSYHQLYGNK
jgi:CRISPR/Cas system-associated exonuclease Cas4 (RecB family)